MAQPILGVIVAVEYEARLVRRGMRAPQRQHTAVGPLWRGPLYGQPVVLVRCGIGAERATQAMEWLLQAYSLTGVISVGFAGGLGAALATGDAILPQSIRAVSEPLGHSSRCLSAAVKPDAHWSEVAAVAACRAALVVHGGVLLSLPEVVSDTTVKARLGQTFGAQAVDMETYRIGQMATAHHLPFAVLRTIFDGRDDAVPLQVRRFTTSDGALQPGRLAGYLLRQPHLVPQMLPLWRKARLAGGHLERWLQHFFTRLSVPGSGL